MNSSSAVNSRVLAATLLELSQSQAGASQICSDESCMAGLVNLFSSDDTETVELALQSLTRLCSVESNREKLVRRPGLIVAVSQLGQSSSQHQHQNQHQKLSARAESLAATALSALVNSSKTPVKTRPIYSNLTNAFAANSASYSASASASSTVSSSASSSVGVRYLFTVIVSFVGLLVQSDRDEVEKYLVSYRGIISVNLQRSGVATLYSRIPAAELMPNLIESLKGKFEKFSVANWKSKEENGENEKENANNENTNHNNASTSTSTSAISNNIIGRHKLPAKPATLYQPQTPTHPSPSIDSSASAYSYSRQLTVHSSATDSAPLASKFAARQKNSRNIKANENTNEPQSAAKNLFSSVSAFFW